MTCAEFQCWLDDGRPDDERSRMIAHSSGCIHCEQELIAALELDRLLAAVVPVSVNPGFNDLVLRRIQSPRRGSWRWVLDACGQIMAEPLVAVSLALATMIGWYHDVLIMQLTAGADRALRAIDRLPWLRELTILRALVVAGFMFAVSWRLFRVVQQAVGALRSTDSLQSSSSFL
jgi:hypothetical protein